MTIRSHRPKVLTFGCRLNAYESEIIRRNLNNSNSKNVVVVNTCAVTAEAERQARQAIRRARREAPDARIIVTGCAAQISPGTYGNMKEVDQVIGNTEKLQPGSFRGTNKKRIQVSDIMSAQKARTHMVEGFEGRARALVQIQNGCDYRCTFCTIPFGRGNSRSVPKEEVALEVSQLISRGYKEIVLTGVDITSYGRDLPEKITLGELTQYLIHTEHNLAHLRLSSLDPAAVDGQLWTAIRDEPKLMPHMHLSVQAGDDLILKRMKRRHSRKDTIEFCDRARALRPNITLGADLIAGFPTETEPMFNQTLSLIRECRLSFLHVFPYSPRDNTPAALMPMVPIEIRRTRAAQLRAVGAKVRNDIFKSCIGDALDVLAETRDFGRTGNNIPVRFLSDKEPGHIYRTRLVGMDGDKLLGHGI